MSARCVRRRIRRPEGNILRDDIVTLKVASSRRAYPEPLRRVVALVEIDGVMTEMTFITNNMGWLCYFFDFLGLDNEAHEQEIEDALTRQITRFLLELGAGFAFVGRQVRLEVDGDEFFIDLLFYHVRLRRYVVVELKATAFKPEHAGQINFYLAAVDAQLRGPGDGSSIGLLLCKTKKRLVAEYALSGIDKPVGVAEYRLVRSLPEPLGASLPSIESLEVELSAHLKEEKH